MAAAAAAGGSSSGGGSGEVAGPSRYNTVSLDWIFVDLFIYLLEIHGLNSPLHTAEKYSRRRPAPFRGFLTLPGS